MVGQGLAVAAVDRGHDRRDRAVQRELDQHPGGGRHRARHRVEEAARAPVQQRAEHQEQQVIGVQPGDRQDRRLGRELVDQPAAGQQYQQDDQQRAVLQPLAGPGRRQPGRSGEAHVDPAILGVAGAGGARRGHVGDHQRDQDQRQQHDPGLPEEDGLGEGDHPGDRQDRRWQAGRVGLQLRGRRRQAQRPHRAQPEVGRGAGGAVVHAQVAAARQGAYQQAAEDQAEAPVEQRGEHRHQRHPADRRAAILRHPREQVDETRGGA